MSEQANREVKNGADALVLAEIHRRLDWVSVDSVIARNMTQLETEGFIQNWRFKNLEVKVNGTWYKLHSNNLITLFKNAVANVETLAGELEAKHGDHRLLNLRIELGQLQAEYEKEERR